ncbi:MAG: LPS export ABC transporter permease LptG [Desulfuromonadales bacterium]
MSLLDRYILKSFIRNLVLVLFTLFALYSLIDFLEKVDDFIEYHAEPVYYLLYPLYHLPVVIADSLPMAVLLATFATFGGFSRTNQLTAMYSCGISFKQVSRSLFLFSLGLVALVLVANLWLVPWSYRESNYLLRTEISRESPSEESSKDIYLRDDNRILIVNQVFPAKNFVLGLTIIEFDDDFKPVKRIQATKANYLNEDQWQLENVTMWDFAPAGGNSVVFHQQPELLLDLKRHASEMLQLSDRPEDLTINELLRTVTKLRNEGYDPQAYRVEIQMRFARAAVPTIMVLIGIPFALQRGRNTSFSLGVVISLVIFACYFALHAIFVVFGAIAVLPPVIAAWAANLLMSLIGTWFLLHVGD